MFRPNTINLVERKIKPSRSFLLQMPTPLAPPPPHPHSSLLALSCSPPAGPSSSPPSAASSTSVIASSCGSCEFVRYILVGALQDLDDFSSETRVLLRNEKGDRRSLLSSTSGTPDTVNVRISVVGEVKVDYHFDIIDVESSRGDVGSNEKGGLWLGGVDFDRVSWSALASEK